MSRDFLVREKVLWGSSLYKHDINAVRANVNEIYKYKY